MICDEVVFCIILFLIISYIFIKLIFICFNCLLDTIFLNATIVLASPDSLFQENIEERLIHDEHG